MTPGQRNTSTASMLLPGTVLATWFTAAATRASAAVSMRNSRSAACTLRRVHRAIDLAALEVLAEQLS